MANARRGRSREKDHKLRDESPSSFVHARNRGSRGEGAHSNLADTAMEGRDTDRSAEMTQERIERGRGDDRLDELIGPDLERDEDVER